MIHTNIPITIIGSYTSNGCVRYRIRLINKITLDVTALRSFFFFKSKRIVPATTQPTIVKKM